MSTASGSETSQGVDPAWRAFFRRRLVEPLWRLLGGGLSPRSLAWALAVGALVGSMPLIWGTSLLCLGAALLLRLNPLAVQVGNYAAWPLQCVLAYPYLRLGAAWFGSVAPAAEQGNFLLTLALANGAALGAWAVTAPLLLPLLYAAGRRLVAAAGRVEGLKRRGGERRFEPAEGGKTMSSIVPQQYRPTDDEPYMNPKQLAYFRQLLLRQRRELAARARDSMHSMRAGAPQAADPVDQGLVAAERDFFCQARRRHVRLLARIEEALARIEEGNYGYCEETGEAIGLQRLLAQPAATFSVEAQERIERLERLARSQGVAPSL